ncbi:MAG TPA: extracellular solute-binding protein [Solirubrobacteraceae bacterium]|jgi:iron(III) transport system substrate-binding protein|nr:extracellular solute-binding protein [Solirubrobacteraceae bacterium]
MVQESCPSPSGATSRRWRLSAVLLALAAVVAGCGGSSSSKSLTLYNGQHEQTTAALVARFEKLTGISVNIRSNDEDALASQIAAEGPGSPADAIYAENSPPLDYLQRHGLLVPVAPATLARTPRRYDSPQGDWVGVSARVSVLIYNTQLLKRSQLPNSVMQLAEPQWKGKLAFAPSETDFQPIVTSVAHTYGDAGALRWLQGMKANAGSHIYPNNETTTNEINRGQAAIGLIDQYYWYRQRAQVGASGMHSAIAYLGARDPGYVMDVSGAAVLKSSSHQAQAQKLLAFLVSAQGERIIARSDSFEYPLGSGVKTSQAETPFAQLRPNPIGVASLGDGSTAISLLQKAQLL